MRTYCWNLWDSNPEPSGYEPDALTDCAKIPGRFNVHRKQHIPHIWPDFYSSRNSHYQVVHTIKIHFRNFGYHWVSGYFALYPAAAIGT